jgi:ferredoxin
MPPRVIVDPDVCVGSGDCALVAPEAFEVDEDEGVARVRSGAASTSPDLLRRAAYECPTGAITVDDD